MPQHLLDNLREGMSVCDLHGEKIGTVKQIHQRAVARAVGGAAPPVGVEAEPYIQVDVNALDIAKRLYDLETEVPGLAKEMYIPLSAFRNCTSDCCFLDWETKDLRTTGWDRKPANI